MKPAKMIISFSYLIFGLGELYAMREILFQQGITR